MNRTLLRELHRVLDAAEADDQVRALVVTGDAGTFCSGFDLKEQLEGRTRATGKADRGELRRRLSAAPS